MSKLIIDNASGPTGVTGIVAAKLNDPSVFLSFAPSTPSEWLICVSTLVLSCQLIHWVWRFVRWFKNKLKR